MSTDIDWARMPCVSFDIESTAPDPFKARIVQAACVKIVPGQEPVTRTWLVDPGIEIPEGATAVHGITTEYARTNQTHTVPEMLSEVTGILARSMQLLWPVVVMNAAYDLTLVEQENIRHQVPSLASRVEPLPIGPILDPMVLDKHCDPFRQSCYRAPGCDKDANYHECGGCRGSGRDTKRYYDCGGCGATDHTLSSICRHYGIELTAAHDAGADALAAAQLAVRLLTLFPHQFRGVSLGGLHMAQIGWRAHQMNGLRDYFDKAGITHDGCDPAWPLRTTAPTPTHQEVLI